LFTCLSVRLFASLAFALSVLVAELFASLALALSLLTNALSASAPSLPPLR
jgi:hypothetical protein